MDSAIFFDAPFRLDFWSSPRCAASAAPAAICCFFDLAGILFNRRAGKKRMYARLKSKLSWARADNKSLLSKITVSGTGSLGLEPLRGRIDSVSAKRPLGLTI